MVKSETRRDAEILVRNPSPRLFGKKFRDSKKVKTNHAKTRLRDLSKTLPRFRDPAKIFRDPRFSRHHSSPLINDLFYGQIIVVLIHNGFSCRYLVFYEWAGYQDTDLYYFLAYPSQHPLRER